MLCAMPAFSDYDRDPPCGEASVHSDPSDLTSQLNAARAGDRDAAEQALRQVYIELKRVAGALLRGNALTLDATSLVHDAFLRLIPEADRQFADRRHFFRLAARAMRQILVDHVRARSADKRGGRWVRTELTDRLSVTEGDRIDLLAVDAALTRLQGRDRELAEIVEAYFFAGFTFEEIADIREVGERTIRRQWEVARLFLLKELSTP
jgi:RNA polymerase sigma factor (TIGR02999 family)